VILDDNERRGDGVGTVSLIQKVYVADRRITWGLNRNLLHPDSESFTATNNLLRMSVAS